MYGLDILKRRMRHRRLLRPKKRLPLYKQHIYFNTDIKINMPNFENWIHWFKSKPDKKGFRT